MENSKKKIKKSVNDETKESKTVSDLSDEEKIQKALEDFEIEARKTMEEYIYTQRQLIEKQIRNETVNIKDYEILDDKNKNYEITFMVVSSRMKFEPIWIQTFPVTGDFNEFDAGKHFQETIDNFLKSDKYRAIQKKLYYKLKMQGVKPTEIYRLIERDFWKMDTDEKERFRRMLRRYFTRRTAKQKGDKKADL